ncbi:MULTISPECIES: hypothetical protein [Bacillaceae]|uniref:hypothetical protein n=1 Tax=Bacillaceae TaxID=186817 RepID=UPI0011236883|nr:MULTISPECIES: hypothetical protein [Bacillaceae]TNO59941.1 hypothetical protein FHR06_28395 [Bacillus cereus]TNO98991.1 hypothetical protein FHY65_27365 [Bacillus cereus]TNP19832.1 hypothetical protein FH036_26830 [Bacillus sp. CD3-5]TNU54634.1 hypothetical protein FH498_19670 [Bacillus velezensis]UED82717.1 hypothetical protein FH508_0023965 [Lysinibacillus sp. CD3-6]
MSKLNRKSKHFRMSVESIAFLEALAEKIGVTDTEIVERGISELAAQEFTAKERKEMITKKIQEVLEL